MANPVLQAISGRRSIRAYTGEQIKEEQLTEIINAALAAPSASNAQPWHFSVVQDQELLSRINEAFLEQAKKTFHKEMAARFENPAYSVFFNAPTVIFISCPSLEEMKYAQTDTGIAIENMALAAHALGLGSVILGMPRLAFDGPHAESLRQALQFPTGHDYCLSIAIGTPATTKEAHPVNPDRVTIIR